MCRWFVFSKGMLLLKLEEGPRYSVPHSDKSPVGHDEDAIEVTMPDGAQCKAILLENEIEVEWGKYVELRTCFNLLDYKSYREAGKAEELLQWNSETRFCGKCGAPLVFHTEISKRCPNCHNEYWPRLSPAMIVLISKGEELLLVQSRDFKRDFYGLVAGFVETGESVEECVYREVLEETGIKIHRLRYFKSQPWPYPMGLMLGFFAEYESGELKLQNNELKRGGWFHKDAMPQIPGRVSLARQLIDTWLESFNP